jgi:hypothetical protein
MKHKKNIADDPLRRKQFDFKRLNEDFNGAYHSFKKKDTAQARTELFSAVYALAFACSTVGYAKKLSDRDRENIATEFAFSHVPKLLDGSFSPTSAPGTKFPADKYYSLAVRNTILSFKNGEFDKKGWERLHVLMDDLELFVEDNAGRLQLEDSVQGSRSVDARDSNRAYARDLYRALRLLYSAADIERLLPLATEILYTADPTASGVPDDLRRFALALRACAQRLATDHGIDSNVNLPRAQLDSIMNSALRSTLFLAAATHYDRVPRDLLLALDHRTLYRLAYVLGGTTIRVPTLRELQTLQNAVTAAVAVYTAPEAERSRVEEEVRKFDDVLGKKRNTHGGAMEIVSKMIASHRLSARDDQTQFAPLMNVILKSVQSLEFMVDRIHRAQLSPGMMLQQYAALTKSLGEIIDRILALDGADCG